MIRRSESEEKSATGERREIGRSGSVSFLAGSRVECFDPEGTKNPGGERRLGK
jgi:hypothetical protein